MTFLKYSLLLTILGGVLYCVGFKDGYHKKEAQYNRAKVSAQLQAQKYKAKKKHEITRSVDSDLDERLNRGLRDGSV